MRLLVIIACMAAVTTTPALASPRRLLCIVHPDAIATALERNTAGHPRRHLVVPDVHRIRLTMRPRRAPIIAVTTHDDGEVEVPWLWRVLRERALAHLPHHDATSFSLALSPVVVTSPSDTIPGVGVAGSF